MGSDSVEDRLASLTKIHKKGVVSQEEYAELRKNILNAAYGSPTKATKFSRLEIRFMLLLVAVVSLTLSLPAGLGWVTSTTITSIGNGASQASSAGRTALLNGGGLTPRRLLLCSHGRVLWFYLDTQETSVLHEGECRA
jgi:hypothetical protein